MGPAMEHFPLFHNYQVICHPISFKLQSGTCIAFYQHIAKFFFLNINVQFNTKNFAAKWGHFLTLLPLGNKYLRFLQSCNYNSLLSVSIDYECCLRYVFQLGCCKETISDSTKAIM